MALTFVDNVPALKGAETLPTDHEPKGSIDHIRKLGALENYYLAAKDLEPLREVIAEKLRAQLRHVLWWDESVRPAGRQLNISDRKYLAASEAEELTGLSILQTSRWRKKLTPEKMFDYTLDGALERCRQICEMEKGNHLAQGTGENEWYTPSEYIALARQVMGDIDLDPASSAEANETVGATTFYSIEDDGLTHDWRGTVWLNPPYSRDLMPKFMAKLRAEYQSGNTSAAIVVTHNNTDTGWFHSLAEVTAAMCFSAKRIKFYRGDDVAAPVNGQVFIYLGGSVDQFKAAFAPVGFVMVPA